MANSPSQGFPLMSRAMSIAGMILAGLVAFVFVFDLALQVPFGRQQPMADLGFAIAAAILGYLSWNAFRESR